MSSYEEEVVEAKLVDRPVGVVLEPDCRDGPNVLLKPT